MKICAFLLVVTCTIDATLSEYSRYKVRGPPGPPRNPAPPKFMKKWQQQHPQPYPQRMPVRSRPIPVHMPISHKIPMGVPSAIARPVAPPVRTFWKNTQTTFRTPLDKPYLAGPAGPEKMFVSSPKIATQEYDFHIQTNNIPTHVNPIKQVGEKGPIHTIPAPNLSLADKPVLIKETKQEQRYPQETYVQIQKSHQYQVTEVPEHAPKLYTNQQYSPPNIQQPTYLSPTDQQLSPKELYQLLNAYPTSQQQQQLMETYAIPIVQQQQIPAVQAQPQIQEIANYQTLLAQQPQLFLPEQNYAQRSAADKISIQPEYHSFNYDEQSQQQQSKGLSAQELSSLVTAAYNLEPNAEASETVHTTAVRNPLGSMAQSQYVQNYFDHRDDSNGNNVQPDAKPSEERQPIVEEEATKDEPDFYSSLPNKEAADALADLQEAGKFNSNLMQLTKPTGDKSPMTIYVPDDQAGYEANNEKKYGTEESQEQEYDDYSQEEFGSEEDHRVEQAFGHRLKSRSN